MNASNPRVFSIAFQSLTRVGVPSHRLFDNHGQKDWPHLSEPNTLLAQREASHTVDTTVEGALAEEICSPWVAKQLKFDVARSLGRCVAGFSNYTNCNYAVAQDQRDSR